MAARDGSLRLNTRADGSVEASFSPVDGALRTGGLISTAYGIFISSYMLWFPALLVGLYLCWCPALKAAAASVAVLYLPSYLDGSEKRSGRPWRWLRTCAVWRLSWRYLGLRVIRTVQLDPAGLFVFGWQPHGILLLSRIASYAGAWERLFPGINTRVLAATPLFRWPLCREMCLWLSAVDAGRKSAENVLRSGHSLALYPGGSREVFTTLADAPDTVFLRQRTGFVRLAMMHGAALVPVYVYAERFSYKRWTPPAWLTRFVLQQLRIPLICFWGRWCTWLPFNHRPLLVVFGAPIAVRKNPEPTEEEVKKTLATYIDAVIALHAAYREEAGYGKDEKLIVE